MPPSILFIERKMMNNRFEKKEKKEKIIYAGEYSDRNNWCWGFPEYMEEYRLARGYEWRDGLLREKVDPRCLNEHGIPTNDFNLPAVPGMNTLPMNARIATKNRYLDQCNVQWFVKYNFDWSRWNTINIPFVEGVSKEEINHERAWGNILDIQDPEKYFKKNQTWTLSWYLKNWRLVIPKSWNYIVDYLIEFYHQKGWDHNTEMRKIYVELSLYKNWVNQSWSLDRSAKYTITNPDYISWTTVKAFEEWCELGLWCILKASDNCFIRSSLNIVKL